jgi:cysteinyl-tRNA synthetase
MSLVTRLGLVARVAVAEALQRAGVMAHWLWRNLGAAWMALWPVLREILGWLRDIWAVLSASERRNLLIGAGSLVLLGWAWSARYQAWHWYDATIAGARPLYAAQSWYYHLDKVEVDRIARSDADLLVIDYAKEEGSTPLSREEVQRLKIKANGQRRLVIAYMSVGEAESYRFYWRRDWTEDDMPGWHVAENCAWPRNHMVRYWHDGWKDIIYRGRRSYLARVIEAGFDGVYLDRVDVYWEQQTERTTARADMIDFVTEMAAAARRQKPGFIFIAQNAEDLLFEKRYRDVIDGLGKEDLLYGLDGTGKRNSSRQIETSLAGIRALRADYKPVFAVEYLPKQELIASARRELLGLGLVPTFADRSLDGYDPLMPREKASEQYGTAEWTERECKAKGKRYW